MAVLAMLQDAEVLPPEGTPEANRIIKVVIQFQSVFMKSDDPAVQAFLSHALAIKMGNGADEVRLRFRATGWTSDVLEALGEQWDASTIDQRERLATGFHQFNVSLVDFNVLRELVAKAQTALEQRGQNMHQVFAQRRREMPDGAQLRQQGGRNGHESLYPNQSKSRTDETCAAIPQAACRHRTSPLLLWAA